MSILTRQYYSQKVCLDVHYSDEQARVGAVLFDEWEDMVPKREIVITLPIPAEYVSGSFFQRELPCLIRLLEQLEEVPSLVIIDGYVWLAHGALGLGGHLFAALSKRVQVIGVAKNKLKEMPDCARLLFRGQSEKPLYITSAGLSPEEAMQSIGFMHGVYRLPSLIKRADQLARGC